MRVWRAMRKTRCGKMNENEERLVDYCLDIDLVIGGTLFQHKDIHNLTWSPDGKTVNQIDHLIINHRWRQSLLDAASSGVLTSTPIASLLWSPLGIPTTRNLARRDTI